MPRRPVCAVLLAAALLLLPAAPSPARGGDGVLTVATWGGAYEESQRRAYLDAFALTTGVEVRTVPYHGGVAPLRDRPAEGPAWDVVDMIRSDARTACTAGLLRPFDPTILAPAPDGTPAERDFLDGAFGDCSVTHLVFSTVIAYDVRAFPGVKPRRVADFFDLDRFPGRRALRKAPVGLFEWALMSYGVPRRQLYDLLSTRRGLDLAFRRLESIRHRLTWWTAGSEPVEMLRNGEVVMASGYNGRFFHARVNEGAPIAVIWDGQLLDSQSWAIPRDSDDPDLAERFIRFATNARRMAAQAGRISYGPARESALARVGLHVESGVPMRPHLPTAPRHMETAIPRDEAWYTRTVDLRRRRFRAWLSESGDQSPP